MTEQGFAAAAILQLGLGTQTSPAINSVCRGVEAAASLPSATTTAIHACTLALSSGRVVPLLPRSIAVLAVLATVVALAGAGGALSRGRVATALQQFSRTPQVCQHLCQPVQVVLSILLRRLQGGDQSLGPMVPVAPPRA